MRGGFASSCLPHNLHQPPTLLPAPPQAPPPGLAPPPPGGPRPRRGPSGFPLAPRGGSRAAPRLHVNERGAAGADWLRRAALAPPPSGRGGGGGWPQPGAPGRGRRSASPLRPPRCPARHHDRHTARPGPAPPPADGLPEKGEG